MNLKMLTNVFQQDQHNYGGLSVEDLNKNNNFCEDTDIKFHFITAGSQGKRMKEVL